MNGTIAKQYLDDKALRKKLGLIRYFRFKWMIRNWKKLAKRSKHRFNVLKEWAETQQNYINDLNIMVEKIEGPMMKSGLINEEQKLILFPNLGAIISLSKELLRYLKGVLKDWNPNQVVISQELNKFHYFFKIYMEYCKVFCKGQNILKELKGHPTLRDIEKTLTMDLPSYFIKPVQRPPKYMLLLRDYQKYMPQTHKDYSEITKTICNYHKVNEINNNSIAKESRTEKTFYLEKLSGGTLLNSSREFVGEYQALMGDQSVVLYVFTDLVMICNNLQVKETICKMIYLNGSSYVEIIPDGKYYTNYLFLCGKSECVHLNFYNKDGLSTVFENLNNRLDAEFEKQDQRRSIMANNLNKPVKVRVTLAQNKIQTFSRSIQFRIMVIGAEKRPLSLIRNDTIYIVKVHIHRPWPLAQYIFLRYSVMEEIQSHLKKSCPNLDIPRLSSSEVSSYDEAKNSTKIVEFRSMAITEFLNIMFRNEKVMSNPIFLIGKLRIEENFWNYALEDEKSRCRCELCLNKGPFSVDSFFREKFFYMKNFRMLAKEKYCMKKYMNDVFELLKNSNISVIDSLLRVMAWINSYLGRIDYSKIYKKVKPGSNSIKIWFANIAQECIQLKIQPESTVGQAMVMIAKDFNIQCIDDFGLFLDYNGKPRLLDSDENICEVMSQVESDITEVPSGKLLDRLQKWGSNIIEGKKSKLYFRKYLFVGKNMERTECKSNLERYRIVIEQIFYDVRQGTIHLSKEEMIEMAANFVSLKSLARLPYLKKTNLPKDTLRLLLPPAKESLIQNSIWIQAVCEAITWNKEKILDSPNQMTLLYQNVLQIVEDKESYRCMWFRVSNYYPESIGGSLKEVQIGTNFQHFMVLDPKNHELKVSIPLLQLKYRTTIYSIFIDTAQMKYRFDGQMLENLSNIIEKYKIYNRLFSNLETKMASG